MRTLSGSISDGSTSASRCWASSAADRASAAASNTASTPSPVCDTIEPLFRATAPVMSSSWRARARAIRAGCASHFWVLPSMSLKRNVRSTPIASSLASRAPSYRAAPGDSAVLSAAVNGQLGGLLHRILGDDLPIRFEFYDGSAVGPADSPATIVITRPEALSRMLYAPGELGVAHAYIAGDLVVEGDFLEALRLRERMPVPRFDLRTRAEMAKVLGRAALHRPAPPPEEVKLRGRFHSTARDQAAVSHHYDVSNDFYELLLGETMLYSCALWSDPHGGLDKAQTAKIDLVCRKLDIQPGMRGPRCRLRLGEPVDPRRS